MSRQPVNMQGIDCRAWAGEGECGLFSAQNAVVDFFGGGSRYGGTWGVFFLGL